MSKKKRIKYLLTVTLITYACIEIVCFAFIKTGYVPARLPRFFNDPVDTLVFPFSYADINPDWGVWHYTYPVKVPYGCLTLEINPNAVGARDKERARISNDTSRCIVLGDSFMEGFGLPVESRMSNILEKSTGKEFLNFACADMGSTQEYMIYKYLASGYTHNSVIIGILPANDFLNDNVTFDAGQTPRRYKPYWKGTYPGMSIFYFTDSLQYSQFNYEAYKPYKATFKYKCRHFLENTTYWFNIVYFLAKKGAALSVIDKRKGNNESYSGYYDFTADDLDRLKQSLFELKKLAGNKQVIAVTIPVREDFYRYNKMHTTPPPLTNKLDSFCRQQGITYVDMLTTASANDLQHYDQFYFDCDMHIAEKGNEWIANKLAPFFKNP